MWVPPRFIPDGEVVLGELEFSGVGPPISEEEKRRAREQYDGDEPADIGPISEEAREKANDLLPPADGDLDPQPEGVDPEGDECIEDGCHEEGNGWPQMCRDHHFEYAWGPQVGECDECGGRLCRNRWGDDDIRVTCYDCMWNVPESDHDPIDPSEW